MRGKALDPQCKIFQTPIPERLAHRINRPMPAHLLDLCKLRSLLSTSLGMASVMRGLLALPESGSNRHRRYAHARYITHKVAEVDRRSIRMLGAEPEDTPSPPGAERCDFHKLSETLRDSRVQFRAATGLLDQAEPVPGLHGEYRDALSLACLSEYLLEGLLANMAVEPECRRDLCRPAKSNLHNDQRERWINGKRGGQREFHV